MFKRIKKWFSGPTEGEHRENGYLHAAAVWKEKGDDCLMELEAQAYGHSHPFDQGIRAYIADREKDIVREREHAEYVNRYRS